jgi:hypothetical protein
VYKKACNNKNIIGTRFKYNDIGDKNRRNNCNEQYQQNGSPTTSSAGSTIASPTTRCTNNNYTNHSMAICTAPADTNVHVPTCRSLLSTIPELVPQTSRSTSPSSALSISDGSSWLFFLK